MKLFFLEGEISGVPGIVRWYVVSRDGALKWFDEDGAQQMFGSTVANKLLWRLEVKEAHEAPPPSRGPDPPAYSLSLETGLVVVGYLVKPV